MNINPNRDPKFHPSLFEDVSPHTPKEERTLSNIRDERASRLTSDNITELKSPGKYNVTIDDTSVAKNNTRFMFKNLYTETLLTQMFFSEQNIKNIQNILRLLTFKETNYVISDQSVTELLIIMRSIFLEYSAHPPLLDKQMSKADKDKVLMMYRDEVSRLNDIVINYVVPKVVSQIQQYISYLEDASSQPYQMDLPKNVSSTGTRDYRSITSVLTGESL